jgi:conjugal transfer mating pair stabilization protein TraG
MRQIQNINADKLLDTIAHAESKSNYNAYFGNPTNTSIKFTSMTISEVLTWQEQFVQQGNPSTAVGRYQFIDSTLKGLIDETGTKETDIFDKELQDKLAYALLERRGIREYVDEKINRETFAHNLSKEWAGLPKVIGDNPEQSYYSGDGLNKAQVDVHEVLEAIDTVREVNKNDR